MTKSTGIQQKGISIFGTKYGMYLKIAIAYAVLILISVVWLLPLYIAVITASKSNREIYQSNVLQPPTNPLRDPWVEAWNRIARGFLNSIIVSIPATFLAVLIGVMAGYYLARYRFRGAQTLFFTIAVASFIPYQIVLIPLVQILSSIGLMGTHIGLILAYVLLFSPWAALISAAFFMTIPKELEEAALIDGATPIKAFFRIVLPVALPGIISTTIIIFMNIWNEFLIAVTLSTNPLTRTVQPEIANLRGTTTVSWNTLMAGSVIAILPPMIIVILLGRYFVKGLLAGALKGT
ncbi:MAG: carbohydrate ABC transporter permease [Thermoprotei archaeon]